MSLSSNKTTAKTFTTVELTRDISPILDRKIDETTAGISPYYAKYLRSINTTNSATIVDYIASMRVEVNLSDHYRKNIIELLCRFSKYTKNKPFKDLIRTEIVAFLDTFRKK